MGLFTWYKEKKLKRLVAWCATTENNQLRYNFSLYDYLHNAQIKYKVDEKYRLRRDRDGKYAKIILEDFQRFIAQDYFYGRIPYQNSRIFNKRGRFLHDVSVYLHGYQARAVFYQRHIYLGM